MGMAASQARLLSITSRMSDNELRAQIINNNKMRLATESSQASERYVQALNNAKYMFSNYDSQNNISYTNLTFNSLTSYNAYNNQYALRNSGGKILISEADAKNYETSSNVNEFLAKYGLSKTTTYFENLSINEKGKVEYSYVNSDGTVVAESSGFTRDQLKAAYFGTGIDDNGSVLMIPFLPSGTKFPSSEFGYDKTLNSPEMYEYVSRLATYQNRRAEFNNLVTPTMKSTFDNIISSYFSGYSIKSADGTKVEDINSYDDLISSINTLKKAKVDGSGKETGYEFTNEQVNGMLDKLSGFFSDSSTGIKKYTTNSGNTYVNDAVNQLNNAKGDKYSYSEESNIEYNSENNEYSTNFEFGGIKFNITFKSDNKAYFKYTKAESNVYEKDDNGSYITDGNGHYLLTTQTTDAAGNTLTDEDGKTITALEKYSKNQRYKRTIHEDGFEGTTTLSLTDNLYSFNQTLGGKEYKFSIPKYDFDFTSNAPGSSPKKIEHLIESDNTIDNKMNIANQLLEGFLGYITKFWDAFDNTFIQNNENYMNTCKDYVKAANDLCELIYGSSNYSFTINKDDKGAITSITKNIAGPPDISALDDISTMYNKQGQDSYKNFDNSFYKIYMNIVLDNIMNTYGEPKTAWINMNDQNDNGEAKAQWYTNLYNRIYQCGYSVLKDGLASSEDWIKYAFESGIVTMEQVDSYNEWNQLNYNNCSDITEQTDARAVTIAEAEYNAAMNKIENKDKRYDLELKNIDTEHNSLQTEYDSIKAAMDKNIERTFKLYG